MALTALKTSQRLTEFGRPQRISQYLNDERCIGRSPSFRPSAILSLLLRSLRPTFLLFKYTEHTLFTIDTPHNDLVRENNLLAGFDGLLPARN
jgi:hypothetical protein